jgi:hypothetical protein
MSGMWQRRDDMAAKLNSMVLGHVEETDLG